MKLTLLLLVAGLGLAQESTKLKVSGSPSQSANLTNWTNDAGNLLVSYVDPDAPKLIYSAKPIASYPFYAKFDRPDNPEVITILNRDGKPLVRCVAKTQTCEVIK